MDSESRGKDGKTVGQDRVRIADIAESLGLSTATVSNVIHGKTGKVSEETVRRVQQELERTGYIPNMAGILLARNDSRILGVVVHDHPKYEGRVLEAMKGGNSCPGKNTLPVELVIRESTRNLSCLHS